MFSEREDEEELLPPNWVMGFCFPVEAVSGINLVSLGDGWWCECAKGDGSWCKQATPRGCNSVRS